MTSLTWRDYFPICKKPMFLTIKEFPTSPFLKRDLILTLMFLSLIRLVRCSLFFKPTMASAPIIQTSYVAQIQSQFDDTLLKVAEPKIAIVTYYTPDKNSQAMKALSFPNFKQYAARYGYDAIDALEEPEIMSVYQSKLKIAPAAAYHLKYDALSFILPRYDWVMWADGDSLFLNQSTPLSLFLKDNPFDAIITVNPKSNDSTWSGILNSGHYFIRNSEWALKTFLPMAQKMGISCKSFFNDLGLPIPPQLNGVFELCNPQTDRWWTDDQGSFQWLLDNMPASFQCHIQRRGFRDFNSEYPWFEDGDFVLHFPGLPAENKLNKLSLVLGRADFNTGIINRTELSPYLFAAAKNSRNAAGMYDEFYSFLNKPCQ